MDEITKGVVKMYNKYSYPTYGSHGDYFKRNVAPCIDEIQPVHKVLDAGCGTGCNTLELSKYLPKAEIVAFDITDASLEYAQELMKKYKAENVLIQKRNFLDANEDLIDFDFVLSQGVIHHLSKPEKGVEQVYNFLKPGGARSYLFIRNFGVQKNENSCKRIY